MHIQGIKGRDNLLKVKASRNKHRCYLFSARFLKAEKFLCTICITKKSGCAVKRNRIRRWFKEAIQQQYKLKPFIINMFLFVIPIQSIDYYSVKVEIEKLFSNLSSDN